MVQITASPRDSRWRRARALAALGWVLTGASAAFWVWQWPGATPSTERQWADARSPQVGSDPALIERVLSAGRPEGETASAEPVALGLVLQGVIVRSGAQGLAVLASNAQPTRAYAVGQTVSPGWVLHAVGPRTATLRASDPPGREQVLSLPERPGSP